jgi:hypothetical protein
MIHVPGATNATIGLDADTIQTDLLPEVNDTGSPELAVADNVNGAVDVN